MGDGLPVVAVRPGEGRCGSTLFMALLGTSPAIVFDRRYPAEYRFLSYLAKVAAQMTERFDPGRHVGLTPFFFGDQPAWGPVPFESDVVDVPALRAPLVRAMWDAWSTAAREAAPGARWYAEKIALPVEELRDAGVEIKVVDLVRDPRDVLASIRAFTARGIDGFGRHPGIDESEYLEAFLERTRVRLDALVELERSDPTDHLVVRYEDLVADRPAVAARVGAWLDVGLDAAAVVDTDDLANHRTTASPADSIGRWHRELAPADADRVAAVLGAHLDRFGTGR